VLTTGNSYQNVYLWTICFLRQNRNSVVAFALAEVMF